MFWKFVLLSALVYGSFYSMVESKEASCSKVYYHGFISDKEKVNFLFTTFDISEKNGYLNYYELELLQRLTNPNLLLDIPTYKYIVKLLGGSVMNGITLEGFNSSYYLYKNTLGTDLEKDYRIIKRLVNSAI